MVGTEEDTRVARAFLRECDIALLVEEIERRGLVVRPAATHGPQQMHGGEDGVPETRDER
jgi:hypothetical protein